MQNCQPLFTMIFPSVIIDKRIAGRINFWIVKRVNDSWWKKSPESGDLMKIQFLTFDLNPQQNFVQFQSRRPWKLILACRESFFRKFSHFEFGDFWIFDKCDYHTSRVMLRHFVPIKTQHFFDKVADTKILKMISKVIYAIKIFKNQLTRMWV